MNILLRAATLPGAELVLPLLASQPLLGAGRGVGRFFDRLGLHFHTDIAEMARGHSSLSDRDARAAFVHTLRRIVDPIGQRVSANDRLYLAEETPFLIIWGKRDSIIPVAHATLCTRGCRAVASGIFEAGHFPQVDEPQRFIEVLTEFIDSTEPSDVDPERWREMLQRR